MMRMTYKDSVTGKNKLHKSFSDLLDWLHAKQPLDFYFEMRHHCSRYLSPSVLGQGASTPIPTVGGAPSSSSPHGDAAALLLGSDSESDGDEDVVCEESDDDE